MLGVSKKAAAIVAIFVAALVFGSNACLARATMAKIGDEWVTGYEVWHAPAVMASTEAAINTIRNLETAFCVWNGYNTRELQVDGQRLRVYGVDEGTITYQKWVYTGVGVLGGHNVPVVEPYRYEETALIPFAQVRDIVLWQYPKTKRDFKWGIDVLLTSGTSVVLRAASEATARNLANAIATLAAAQGKYFPLKPGIETYVDMDAEKKELAKLKWTQANGMMVLGVTDYSPAAKAGLAKNDIVLAVNGQEITRAGDFWKLISSLPAGQEMYTLDITFFRNGKVQNCQLMLPNPNFNISRLSTGGLGPGPDKPSFGLSVRALTAEETQATQLASGQGLVVTEVKPGTLAEQMGFKVNDIIFEANGMALATTDQLRGLLAGGRLEMAKVVRDGKIVTLSAPVSL